MPTERDPEPADLVPRVAETFAELVDVLVDDVEPAAFFDRLAGGVADLIPSADTALSVVDREGRPRVAAASSPRSRDLEAWQLASGEGPSVESQLMGVQIAIDSRVTGDRWARFRERAVAVGYRGVRAFPLRLHGETIGVLSAYSANHPPLDHGQVRLVQSLADVATIALLLKRALRRSEQTSEQLRAALESRVVIEQAKGAVAYSCESTAEEAFVMLRRYSRARRLRLEDVARLVLADPAVLRAVAEQQ